MGTEGGSGLAAWWRVGRVEERHDDLADVPTSPQNDAGIQVYPLGGLTRDDQLVAAFWNGAFEEVVLVDPVDAHATSSARRSSEPSEQ